MLTMSAMRYPPLGIRVDTLTMNGDPHTSFYSQHPSLHIASGRCLSFTYTNDVLGKGYPVDLKAGYENKKKWKLNVWALMLMWKEGGLQAALLRGGMWYHTQLPGCFLKRPCSFEGLVQVLLNPLRVYVATTCLSHALTLLPDPFLELQSFFARPISVLVHLLLSGQHACNQSCVH